MDTNHTPQGRSADSGEGGSMRSLQDAILQSSQLFMRQEREGLEIFTGFETRNQYVVVDQNGRDIGAFAETGSGIGAFFLRNLFKSHRPLEVDVTEMDGSRLFKIKRPFFFFFSDLTVYSPEGKKIGSVHRRFGLIYKKYDLRDAYGRTFARIKSPLWRLWTFPVVEQRSDQPVAEITKKWKGFLQEVFTDADTFCVNFGKHPWSAGERAVVFAAAISIDFDFFEQNSANSDGILGFG